MRKPELFLIISKLNFYVLIIHNLISLLFFVYFLADINPVGENLSQQQLDISSLFFVSYFFFTLLYGLFYLFSFLYIVLSNDNSKIKNLEVEYEKKIIKYMLMTLGLFLLLVLTNSLFTWLYYSHVEAYRSPNYLNGILLFVLGYIKYYPIGIFMFCVFLLQIDYSKASIRKKKWKKDEHT